MDRLLNLKDPRRKEKPNVALVASGPEAEPPLSRPVTVDSNSHRTSC